MNQLTQKALARAIMDLLRTRTLDKITIRDITDSCGLTRNTFYYHFHDIYDLLRWIFQEMTDEIMNKYVDEQDWEGGLEETLAFLYENRQMILHVYESISFDLLLRFVNDVIYRHAEVIVSREAKDIQLSREAITIAAEFYMNAIVGSVLRWIREGMQEKPEGMAHVYNIMFQGTVEAALRSADAADRIRST